MEIDKTMRFNVEENDRGDIEQILRLVYQALEEKGYHPINQIVGYLLSGDPAYIPRHKDARNLIKTYERDEILEEVLKAYLESDEK